MIDKMRLVVTDPFVAVRRLDVLFDRAAKMDVDNLKPLADSEHGLLLRYKFLKDPQLHNIKLGVDVAGAVIFLPEKGGCDISSAR